MGPQRGIRCTGCTSFGTSAYASVQHHSGLRVSRAEFILQGFAQRYGSKTLGTLETGWSARPVLPPFQMPPVGLVGSGLALYGMGAVAEVDESRRPGFEREGKGSRTRTTPALQLGPLGGPTPSLPCTAGARPAEAAQTARRRPGAPILYGVGPLPLSRYRGGIVRPRRPPEHKMRRLHVNCARGIGATTSRQSIGALAGGQG